MAFTYNPTTPTGQCRLIITDTDSANEIFSDAEIAAFLTMEGAFNDDPGATTVQTVYLAAAAALDSIASSETLIQKMLRLTDFNTNGPAEAVSLRKHAAALRQKVYSDSGDWDYAEQVPNPFAERGRIYDQALRNSI